MRPDPGSPAAQQVQLGPTAQELVRGAFEDAGPVPAGHEVVRTGAFVVDPPFFGNGDIGRLAVCGVVNDLAATGAVPRQISVNVFVEAGLPVRLLNRLTRSVREAAREAAVDVAAVDTKVVRAGEADQVFVSASAFGVAPARPPSLAAVRPGDRIVVTGPLGDHAAHILAVRGAPGFEHWVPSDCAPLGGLLASVLPLARFARPVTGGGLAAVLTECAAGRGLTARVRETALPVRHETRVALGLQGLRPWDAACAGSVCLFVPPEAVTSVLERLRGQPRGRRAAVVGEMTDEAADGTAAPGAGADPGTAGQPSGVVRLTGADGVSRVLPQDVDPEPPRLL